MKYRTLRLLAVWLMVTLPMRVPAFAQSVNSDRTTRTVVTNSNLFTITEGTVRLGNAGATLFHSFETFSPAASTVIFDLRDSQNAVDTRAVEAIVGRVTGGASSFIDGQLTVLQDNQTPKPDLFLINPQGIIFGENAQLALPGSFLASTAQSILFSNGAEFSATNPSSAPLLTVSAPVGLQFGPGQSAGITVQGNGHAIATANPLFAPYFPTGTNVGLSVESGESLSLIGGQINLKGGVLSAPGGRIEVGGVNDGIVKLNGRSIDYRGVESFGDVDLSERSLINLTGATAGTAQIQGRQIRLSDGSLIWSQNRGLDAAGAITVSAVEQLLLTGSAPMVDAVSGIVTETLTPGDAGAIHIKAHQLSVEAGAILGSRSFGAGNSGRLDIAAEKARISGYVPIAPQVFSFVGTGSTVTGAAGNVSVSLQDLSLTDGGYLGSATLGRGRSGDVTVTADTVEVTGATPTAVASNISTIAAGNQGNSGDITVRTRRLRLQDSGIISTSSISLGDAGNILVEASERIDISGGLPNLPTSTIASTVDFAPLGIQQLLGLSSTPRGSSGNVSVSAPIIVVEKEGTITVANLAEGDAGRLSVNANFLLLNDGAIDAFTTTGQGGNIDLTVRDVLLMRNDSLVNATALGKGNGGNLRITSPIIIGLGNSDIVASAVDGDGGNIYIATQGIFGLVPSEQRTSGNDISASSQFGLSGTVAVSELALRPDAGLVNLSETVSDSSTQVAKGCEATSVNQFVASGRGGLPVSPTAYVAAAHPWQDIRPVGMREPEASSLREQSAQAVPTEALLEANSWQINASGRVVLGYAGTSLIQSSTANCLI